MIKANEIRIGNFLFNDDGIISKVTGFSPFDYSIRCDEEEGCMILFDSFPSDGSERKGYEMESSYFEPIPLSEEWLLKFGFEKLTSKEEGFRSTSYTYKDKKNFISFIVHFDDGLLSVSFWQGNEKKYVHQLQNLFHSLTGKELEIQK